MPVPYLRDRVGLMRYTPLQHQVASTALRLSGTDFESLRAHLRKHVLPIKITPPDPRRSFEWQSDFAPGPGISILRARYNSSLTYGSDSDVENLNLTFLCTGATVSTIGHRLIEQMPSRAMVHAQPTLARQTMHATDGEVAGVMLRFDADLVSRLLTDMYDGARLTSLDLAPVIDLSTTFGQTLRSMARALDSGLRDAALQRRSPLAMALLAESALRLILTEVPHRLSEPSVTRNGDPAPGQIRRAMSYMRANLHLPITVSDIADAAGISSRSLQLGFRRYYEMSPTQFLRRIRLEAAHAELFSARNTLPVSEVALKWGFTNLGRFAAQYQAEFGHLPSDALKRVGPRR